VQSLRRYLRVKQARGFSLGLVYRRVSDGLAATRSQRLYASTQPIDVSVFRSRKRADKRSAFQTHEGIAEPVPRAPARRASSRHHLYASARFRRLSALRKWAFLHQVNGCLMGPPRLPIRRLYGPSLAREFMRGESVEVARRTATEVFGRRSPPPL
jgi:hypothetical protein